MKIINQIAMIAAKVIEILHWCVVALMIAVLIMSIAAGDWMVSMLLKGIELGYAPVSLDDMRELTTYGFTLQVVQDGVVNSTAILLFSIAAVIILSLMAMVFRNVYLILKKTLQAQSFQPFCKDTTRMVREIGIFFISVPVVGLILSGICFLVLGTATEVSMDLTGVMIGLILLCLSQAFAYGTRLQQDVDGLV